MTGTAEATATHVVSRDGTDIGYWTTGDAPGYDLAREFEDVVAVVDAVAEASGSAVDLYGHSFGGLCAYGAATLTANVRRLVLYEGWPPVDPAARELPAGVGERLDALLAEGDHDAVVATMFLIAFLRDPRQPPPGSGR